MSSLKLRPDNSDNCLIFRETAGPPVFMTPRRLTSSRNPALHDDDLPLNSNLKYHSCHSNRSLNTCCNPQYWHSEGFLHKHKFKSLLTVHPRAEPYRIEHSRG